MEASLFKYSPNGQTFVSVLLILSLLLLVFGAAAVTSVRYQFRGAAGALLGPALYDQSELPTTYSVLSLGRSIPSPVDHITNRATQILFFVFALGAPICYIASLLLLWLHPMTLQQAQSAFVCAEVLNAWSALEVFIVTTIVTMVELPIFVRYMIGDECEFLNQELAKPPVSQWFKHNDYTCFDLAAGLDVGCWILLGAAGLVFVAGRMVMGYCHAALKERLQVQHSRCTHLY